jgi:hypothetical protein
MDMTKQSNKGSALITGASGALELSTQTGWRGAAMT